MDIRDLVRALLRCDLLTARQFVADAKRAEIDWSLAEEPVGLSDLELSVATALVEMFAFRNGTLAPPWTAGVGPTVDLVILDPGLERMPRSFAYARKAGPEPLRRRNLVAPPDFLDVA